MPEGNEKRSHLQCVLSLSSTHCEMFSKVDHLMLDEMSSWIVPKIGVYKPALGTVTMVPPVPGTGAQFLT